MLGPEGGLVNTPGSCGDGVVGLGASSGDSSTLSMGRRKAGMKMAMSRRRTSPPIALAVRATLMPKMDASAPISTLPI